MNKKISVILPVFNVEEYLLQCLMSIKNQTYSNIEVIIIIDGATDNSYNIAQEFCTTDDRFSVYWQKNAGSGPARNAGLKKATGEYIAFVDPDDFLMPDYLELLLDTLLKHDVDFVTSKYRELYTYKNNAVARKSEVDAHGNYNFFHKDEDDIVVKGLQMVRSKFAWLIMNDYIDSPHCKLFKRDIIEKNKIEFPDLRRSQDVVFNIRHFEHITSFCVMGKKSYVYRIVDGEMIKRVPSYYYKIFIDISMMRHQLLKDWNINYDEIQFATYEFRYVYFILSSIFNEKDICVEFIKKSQVLSIVKLSQPVGIANKLTKKMILNECYTGLRLLYGTLILKTKIKNCIKSCLNLFQDNKF